MDVPDQLVVYARQIAIYRAYPVLENGLQPLADYEVNGITQRGLDSKYDHEEMEFFDAVLNKGALYRLHEASDLLYYASCIDEQFKYRMGWYSGSQFKTALNFISDHDISPIQAEKAALAKYGWRSAAPGNKDEEFEIELIKAALSRTS